MRFQFKKLAALLLCLLLIAGLVQPVKADSLPEVGPAIGTGSTTEETQPASSAVAEDTKETEEEVLPVETEEETVPETEAEEEPVQESLPAGLSVEEYLAIKQAVTDNPAVDVYSENNSATVDTENIESGVLLAKRLKKLAQNSEFNAVIFRGSGYMRVRAEANTASDVVGKLYYNAVATLVGQEYTESGLWYHIQSGKVDGYVKSEYMISGAEAMDLLTEVVTGWVTPNNDAQRLFEQANTNSDTLALLTGGAAAADSFSPEGSAEGGCPFP